MLAQKEQNRLKLASMYDKAVSENEEKDKLIEQLKQQVEKLSDEAEVSSRGVQSSPKERRGRRQERSRTCSLRIHRHALPCRTAGVRCGTVSQCGSITLSAHTAAQVTGAKLKATEHQARLDQRKVMASQALIKRLQENLRNKARFMNMAFHDARIEQSLQGLLEGTGERSRTRRQRTIRRGCREPAKALVFWHPQRTPGRSPSGCSGTASWRRRSC